MTQRLISNRKWPQRNPTFCLLVKWISLSVKILFLEYKIIKMKYHFTLQHCQIHFYLLSQVFITVIEVHTWSTFYYGSYMTNTVGIWITDLSGIQVMNICQIVEWSKWCSENQTKLAAIQIMAWITDIWIVDKFLLFCCHLNTRHLSGIWISDK